METSSKNRAVTNLEKPAVLVELKDLNKVFVTDEVETKALNNINLSIVAGEYLADRKSVV